MKCLFFIPLCSVASALVAMADVPSLINYQGRLTDAAGAPITGNKTFEVHIYDAATGGSLLYSESIGSVTLNANGIYHFQFGSAGLSEGEGSETIAITNGSSVIFNKVLSYAPTSAITLSDGTYTWTSTGGSNSPGNFIGSYDAANQKLSAIYLSGAPAAGRTITASYAYQVDRITNALSTNAEHWLELRVNGQAQATRERILTVPFATLAKSAEQATGQLAKDLEALKLQSNVGLMKKTFQPFEDPMSGDWTVEPMTVAEGEVIEILQFFATPDDEGMTGDVGGACIWVAGLGFTPMLYEGLQFPVRIAGPAQVKIISTEYSETSYGCTFRLLSSDQSPGLRRAGPEAVSVAAGETLEVLQAFRPYYTYHDDLIIWVKGLGYTYRLNSEGGHHAKLPFRIPGPTNVKIDIGDWSPMDPEVQEKGGFTYRLLREDGSVIP